MEPAIRTRYEIRAGIMKALAHPTRLYIVDQLAERERCVQELADMVEADLSTVSRHLAQLKHAGIVAAEKRGTQVFYSLRVPCVLGWQSCVEGVLEAETQRHRIALGGT